MTLEEVMKMARAVGLPVEYANIGGGIMCGIIPPNGLERFASACFTAGATAEREEMKQQRDELLSALEKCAAKFREYETIHASKPAPEKAARNAEMAQMAEVAIAAAKSK